MAVVPVQASQTASLPPTPVPAHSESRVEDLARKHAAEVASLQEAFHARLAALDEELQVHVQSVTQEGLSCHAVAACDEHAFGWMRL